MEIGEDEPLQQFNQLSSDQPEAGPSRPRINRDFTSRLRNTVLDQTRTQAPKSGTFSANNDFISLDISDDESTDNNKLDKGKYSNGRDRDDQIPWRGDRNLKRRPDDVNSDARGMARANGSNATSKRTPWINNVNWDDCTNVSHLLHMEVKAYANYISPTLAEHEVRSMLIKLISNAVKKSFPDALVLPFGSYETKLYLPTGDIDLVIQDDSITPSRTLTALKVLADSVRRAGITDQVTIISKAKVPIIKFTTKHGLLPVDISLNQTNGVVVGDTINRFLAAMPALCPLIQIIKSFVNQRNMNEVFSGGLGSYSIVCLVVSFLQMHPKIRKGEIDPTRNLGVLLIEFFELYGKYFNFMETGISVRYGGYYFNKRERGWQNPRRPHLLSIEDPVDTSNDISVGSFNVKGFQQIFAGAHEILSSASYVRAGILSARRRGQAYELQAHGRDPGDMSILSSILDISQKTLNHRLVIQEVFENGTLHRLLGLKRPRSPSLVTRMSEARVKPFAETKDARTMDAPYSALEEDAQRVTSLWGGEEDKGLSSGEDEPGEISRKRTIEEGEVEEDESRYGIQMGESSKRRRLEDSIDVSYTSDSEESMDTADSLAEEERIYAAVDRRRASLSGSSPRAHESPRRLNDVQRRAYWAAKAARGENFDA